MGEVAEARGIAHPIGVGVIGFGWMGRVHTQAYTRVRHHFPGLGLVPELVAVADEVPGRAEEAAASPRHCGTGGSCSPTPACRR
jgi:predicted homoserine dehydrogenase-like protein